MSTDDISRLSAKTNYLDGVENSPILPKNISDNNCRWKPLHIVLTLVFLAVGGTLSYFYGKQGMSGMLNLMMDYSKWMTHNPVLGIFIYMIMFVVLMVCMVPPGIMIALGSFTFVKMYGTLYGILLLAVVGYISEHGGIYATYYICRHGWSLGKTLSKKIKHFDVLNHLVKTRGIKITVLLRVVQVIPYTVINYMMSTTDISHWDYFIGNHAWVTDAIIYTYIGLSVKNISEIGEGSISGWKILFAVLMIALLGSVFYYVIRAARKELDQMIKEDEIKMKDVDDDDDKSDNDITTED